MLILSEDQADYDALVERWNDARTIAALYRASGHHRRAEQHLKAVLEDGLFAAIVAIETRALLRERRRLEDESRRARKRMGRVMNYF